MSAENEGEFWLRIVMEHIAALERRVDALRATDLEAVRLRHHDLSARLEGFPQLFATKYEQDAIKDTAQRLEKDSVSRDLYDQNQDQLEKQLISLTHDKLDASVFQAFETTYHAEQRRTIEEHRNSDHVLAKANEAMRLEILDEHRTYVTEDSYNHRHQSLIRQVDAIERWQYKLVGGLVFATFVAPIVSAVLVYFFTHQT